LIGVMVEFFQANLQLQGPRCGRAFEELDIVTGRLSVLRLDTARYRVESPNDSVHLDFVHQYRKRRRLHDGMLGELLGVVSASVPLQDEAARTNHQTKMVHPPVRPGLNMSLQKTWRENECCGSLTNHGSASKIAGRTSKVSKSSAF
jgi:hypothetical protein